MMEEFEIISYGIKAIKQSLFDFVKKIPVFVFFYSRMFAPVVIVGLATFYILQILGISMDICFSGVIISSLLIWYAL